MLSKIKAILNPLRHGERSENNRTSSNEEKHASLQSLKRQSDEFRERTDKNEENITILVLSKNTENIKTKLFLASLRSVSDYVKIFNVEDDALGYIELISEEKILLIIDYVSDNLSHVLKTLTQVHAILLYSSEAHGEISSYFTAICTTEQQLINEIKSIRQQLTKQLVAFSIYNLTKKEKFSLTQEAGSFLFFQLFKAAFKKLPKNSESKRLMISKYRDYYEGNIQVLTEIDNFEHHYKSQEALQWYTKDSFIYRLINKALLTENVTCLCYFHFYINDLSRQLENEFIKFKKQEHQPVIQFYRGFKTTKERVKHFESNVGNLILTHGYLSATRKRQMAFDSAMKQAIGSEEVNVLFECSVDLKQAKTVILADVSRYVQCSEDNEILFDLGTVFKINSCVYEDKSELWLIKVNASDEGSDITSEYVDYQTANMTESNIILTLGHLIIESGDYDKAERYFDAILRSSVPNDEEIACIYYNIGRVYRLKGEYQRALENILKAYITHSKARPARLTSAAKALNAMGIVHMEQHNVQQAIDAFEDALKLYSKTVQENHPDIGGTLINLGNIYCEIGELENALSCFQRAQKIYESTLPNNHPNNATLLNNLGNLYLRRFQLDLALNAHQKALIINEAILPSSHPEIARNKHNLHMVQTMLADQNINPMQQEPIFDNNDFTIPSYAESIRVTIFPQTENQMIEHSKKATDFIEMKQL